MDDNTVLILGSFNSGLGILSFDLEQGKATSLEAVLPTSVCYGAAIKFGKDKAYLFFLNGSMWEMNLREMTFSQVPHLVLPTFERYPAVGTDGRFILIMAKFSSSPDFPGESGILQIDPVSMTSTLFHVENWPRKLMTPAVYIPGMNTFCGFVAHTGPAEDEGVADVFFIDLNPLAGHHGNYGQRLTTQKPRTTQRTTKIMTTISTIPRIEKHYKFICFRVIEDMTGSIKN